MSTLSAHQEVVCDQLDRVIATAQRAAEEILREECRRVLRRCPSLKAFRDWNGCSSFIGRDGEPVDDERLPDTARDFITHLYDPYSELFAIGFDEPERN